MLWVAVSLAGGSFQTARNGMARSLSGRLPVALLSWSRFAFNLPLAIGLLGVLYWIGGAGAPALSTRYFALVLVAAVTQIAGNVLLVSAFAHATFAQAIVVHKTEVVLAALVGVLAFSDRLSVGDWAGLMLSVVGVGLIARATAASRSGAGDRAVAWSEVFAANRGTGLALGSALVLVGAGFAIRYAGFELVEVNPGWGGGFPVAATTLFHVTWVEVVMLTAWIWVADRAAFELVGPNLPRLSAIGATGFAGSLCWFWAFSMAYVSFVKGVGQIESVFSVVLAIWLWREQRTRDQLPGIALTVAGIILLILA